MKIRLVVACVLSCLVLSAVPLVPEGYKTLPDEEKIIFMEDFSNGLGGWQQTLPGVYSTVPNAGLNGRIGLVAKRTDPDTHPKLVRKFIGVPGKRYVARLFVRADNLRRTDIQTEQPASLRIHPFYFDMFEAQGKYAAGAYPSVQLATGKSTEWKEVKSEFIVPKNAVNGNVTIGGYMPSDSGKITGTLYYSDFEIKQIGELPVQLYPIRPTQLLLDNGGTITVRIHDFAERDEKRFRLRAIANGKEFTAPIHGNDADIAVGALPQGRHTITFQVLDTEAKTIVGQQDYTFTVPAPGDGDFPGSARIDDYGRLIIDGKPFATRMTCVSAHLKSTDVDRLVEAGYNAILPYLSMTMTIDAVDAKPRTIDCLSRSLDYLHSRGLKVIFCMKEQVQKGITEFEGVQGQLEICEYIVRNLKRHPAILCWYITDENPLSEIPRAIELRHRISAIDPFHPILTCTDKSQHQYHFAETGDIMNPDSYPLRRKGPASMAAMRPHLTRNTGLPVWFAAQSFNWGAYTPGSNFDEFRYPTEEEMRSMGLLILNSGARGISYYSYAAIHYRQEKFDPGSSKWFWPQVLSVIQFMREMEPFFTTTTPAQPLEVTSEGKNFVEAKLHRNGDRVCVVITADGPGTAKATFRLPEGLNLKPRFGHTVKNADGSFTFTGTDICSDVLTE